MPSPRPYDLYPDAFTELFIVASGETVAIECDSSAAAARFRWELYAFRTALLRAALSRNEPALLASALLATSVRMSLQERFIALEPRLAEPDFYPTEIITEQLQ